MHVPLKVDTRTTLLPIKPSAASPYLSKANSLELDPPQYARLDQWLFFGWKFITWWPNKKCSKGPKETFGEKNPPNSPYLKASQIAIWEHLQRYSVCDSAKIFFTSKFSYVLFCNPTHKTETGTTNRWGTTYSKPPGRIIMISQSETLSSSYFIFITLVSAGAHAAAPFTSHSNLWIFVEPKLFSWAKPSYVGFSSSNFTVQITYPAPLEMILDIACVRT